MLYPYGPYSCEYGDLLHPMLFPIDQYRLFPFDNKSHHPLDLLRTEHLGLDRRGGFDGHVQQRIFEGLGKTTEILQITFDIITLQDQVKTLVVKVDGITLALIPKQILDGQVIFPAGQDVRFHGFDFVEDHIQLSGGHLTSMRSQDLFQVELVEFAHAFAGGFFHFLLQLCCFRVPGFLSMGAGKLIIQAFDAGHGTTPGFGTFLAALDGVEAAADRAVDGLEGVWFEFGHLNLPPQFCSDHYDNIIVDGKLYIYTKKNYFFGINL